MMMWYRTPLLSGLSLMLCVAHAQEPDRSPPAPVQNSVKPTAEGTPLDPVEVTAVAQRGYLGDTAQVDTFGSFGNAPLHDTPAAITVITRDQLDDRQPRTLSELVRADAAVGDNYAPVGYYQDVAIRGFVLDLATAYRMNEMIINGEQLTPLEDKQRVEILKGLGGLQAGVIAPGGIINYVSKRPADVHSATLGTDSHGSRYAAADLGGWFSPSFGVRVNVAREDIHSYVEHAPGQRNFFALAADWKISTRATLQLDTNYQSSDQRSVSGYQLLGGTTIPTHPDNTRLLGYEPWQQPVGIDSSNTTARLDYRVSDQWRAQFSASHSHTVIDDNVAFAYGCFYAPECATGEYPGWFFAPNGDYDIYDYRNPDDTRQNDELRAVLNGGLTTGDISHELSLGASAFRRTLDRRPYVYDYVGTGNIDQVDPPYFAPSPNQPGPSARTLTSWQHSLFALDRVHLGDTWQLLAGARLVRLHERAYDDSGEVLQRDTRVNKTLPQAALLWQPSAPFTVYTSYSENLALGAEAPYWASNGGDILAPVHARQLEAGVKIAWTDSLSLQGALYRLRQPYQFAQPDDSAAGFTFIQQGQETHSGLELNLAGRVSDDLRLTASINLIQARAHNTGSPTYEDHQVVNVPRMRAATYLDYRLPFAPAFGLLGGWRYSASNIASPDGRTEVPAYNVFDAGLRYTQSWQGHTLTWRLNVDNVFNKFYWRDTGSSSGDSYLFPGAPRLARFTLQMDF